MQKDIPKQETKPYSLSRRSFVTNAVVTCTLAKDAGDALYAEIHFAHKPSDFNFQ